MIYLIKLTILSYSISEKTADIEKDINLFVRKIFQSWDHVANFMKRYAAVKGHGVRIGGGGKVDKANGIIKRTYLCRHAGQAKSNRTALVEKQHPNASSCRVRCPWKVNIWNKKSTRVQMLRQQRFSINTEASILLIIGLADGVYKGIREFICLRNQNRKLVTFNSFIAENEYKIKS